MTSNCAGPESRDLPPWETRRLWSLWDMLTLHAGSFMHLLQVLFQSELEVGRTRGPLPPGMISTNQTAIEAIEGMCDASDARSGMRPFFPRAHPWCRTANRLGRVSQEDNRCA